MASAAPSPLASSVEKTNGAKLSRLLIDGGTTVLRKIFDGHHPPANLAADLNANKSSLSILLKKKVLHKPQWDKLFPPGGVAPDSKSFDITLLFLLLTNICGLTPPPSGWHIKPLPSDTSHEANLARVKFYRNVLYGHVTTTGVDTPTFSALWTEISGVLVSLGLDQTEVDSLRAEKGGEQDYIDVLIEWADSEEYIKSQLKNMHQSQSQMHQVVEDVRQAQMKTQTIVEDIHQTQVNTQKTVEDIHQTQAKTQETVEDIHNTQASTQKIVEDMHKSQTKTHQNIKEVHQTMEEVLQTQVKTQHTIEEVRHEHAKSVDEVAAGLKEIKETVESLKEKKDKDKAEEVLRNLAKSEFSGDIEYHLQRFQEGTREWVFDRFQNWLDDRSSQNRVMVISGNAGMGKSVIAAVICKRMQEAGRLSGSHFCQYNNVRYRKPQLMIQSLACHLSHALPEYKQALVEQLSRNLGTDLNNMGVEELFALLFKEPLSAVGDPGRNMLMVIDGLDESKYQGRNELLDVIANQFCKLPIWIRFLVTTRPALNIVGKLKHLKPFELKSNDEKNLEDIRLFCLKKLDHMVKEERVGGFVERLVLKSEGLMLYAHFLILSITENSSAFHRDPDGSFPLGISSVYLSYFQRLERELLKELNIKEEHFLNMLSAIIASRESLPLGFVTQILLSSSNSPLERRKVLRTLSSVSALLPVRDDCLHVIHKSVKDWLTDISCYGEHEFVVDENEGHRILAALCTGELNDLKRKGADNVQFSATEKYALHHGARHILHAGFKREPLKLNELTKSYIVDLEIVYAKTCLNSTIAAEDLLWLQKQENSTLLSAENQSVAETLSFLLRKFLYRFTDTPRTFLQTMVNEGGKVLSVEAANLLQSKYHEIPYMENVHKETQQDCVVARFECSSPVVCLDVSPQLDYMVCECEDGMLQLWALHTGKLVWTRPVVVEKTFKEGTLDRCARNLPSEDSFSLFRSVVFHPKKECLLPGTLSQAYTMDGDLKPLFAGSSCRFLVCSISGDKTKILTNCLENSKCLVLWSLESGLEIDRIPTDEDILSFAWSRDGRLLAISHSSGIICLVGVMQGFRKLAQLATPKVCGMLKFSPNNQFVFCLHSGNRGQDLFYLRANEDTQNRFSLSVWSNVSCNFNNFGSSSDCGFVFGDLFIPEMTHDGLMFVLDEQHLLRCNFRLVEMVDGTNIETSAEALWEATGIALSLDGQTVYVASKISVFAWDVESEKRKAEINRGVEWRDSMCPVRRGLLISTRESTVELWDIDLSKCIKNWTNLPGVEEVIPITEERVAIVRNCEVTLVDTSDVEFLIMIPVLRGGRVVACNSKSQLLTVIDSSDSLFLMDGTTTVWGRERVLPCYVTDAVFSPMDQFVIVTCMYPGPLVVDAVSGNILRALSFGSADVSCKFVSEEECVVFDYNYVFSAQLCNVKSGELLSVIDVESRVDCSAACPRNRLLAIGRSYFAPSFKIILVHLPRDKDSKNKKR